MSNLKSSKFYREYLAGCADIDNDFWWRVEKGQLYLLKPRQCGRHKSYFGYDKAYVEAHKDKLLVGTVREWGSLFVVVRMKVSSCSFQSADDERQTACGGYLPCWFKLGLHAASAWERVGSRAHQESFLGTWRRVHAPRATLCGAKENKMMQIQIRWITSRLNLLLRRYLRIKLHRTV